MSKIEKELLRRLKIDKQGNDESRQDYLNRVIDDVEKLEDPAWKKLSEDTKDWTNAAANARRDKKKLPDFPDVDGAEPKATSKAKTNKPDKPAKDNDKPAKSKSNGKAPAAKSKKADDGDTAPKKKGKVVITSGEGMSPVMFVRRYVIEHPDASASEVSSAVTKAGYKKVPTDVTINSLRSEMRNCIRICAELGWFKDSINLGI